LVSNPSSEQNMSKYLMSLAEIGKNQEHVPIANLEPQFDLYEAWEKLEREPLGSGFRVVDPGWQALEETGFDSTVGYGSSNFWLDLVTEPLRNSSEDLTRFLNFYIRMNIDMLVQALHENWGMRGVEDDWRLYDLMCNYKYLDKRMKKWINNHGADEDMRRPCLWDCVCSKKSKATGYCERTY